MADDCRVKEDDVSHCQKCGNATDYLLAQGVLEDHIIRIELDQRRYYRYRNPIILCEDVEKRIHDKAGDQFYLFVDEVQFTSTVRDEENGGIEVTIYDMLNELKSYKNLDVYVTGSNSRMLSKDIATEFRGRATQVHVYPLSFQEFYSSVRGDKQTALDQYMLYGGMPRTEAAEGWMEALDISSLRDAMPAELSGGELRRMAIARTLTADPAVILADEPTGDLDNENTEIVLNALKQAAKAGKAVLVVSHEDDAEAFADRVLHMENGNLTES